MFQQLKKYGSIFLLLLFLFPIVEKQIHAIDHLDDVRCKATDKHFHEMEHTCSICEFTITDSCIVPDVCPIIVLTEHRYFFQSLNERAYLSKTHRHLPSRGPPAC